MGEIGVIFDAILQREKNYAAERFGNRPKLRQLESGRAGL